MKPLRPIGAPPSYNPRWDKPAKPSARRTEACSFFNTSGCTRGISCRFQHVVDPLIPNTLSDDRTPPARCTTTTTATLLATQTAKAPMPSLTATTSSQGTPLLERESAGHARSGSRTPSSTSPVAKDEFYECKDCDRAYRTIRSLGKHRQLRHGLPYIPESKQQVKPELPQPPVCLPKRRLPMPLTAEQKALLVQRETEARIATWFEEAGKVASVEVADTGSRRPQTPPRKKHRVPDPLPADDGHLQ